MKRVVGGPPAVEKDACDEVVRRQGQAEGADSEGRRSPRSGAEQAVVGAGIRDGGRGVVGGAGGDRADPSAERFVASLLTLHCPNLQPACNRRGTPRHERYATPTHNNNVDGEYGSYGTAMAVQHGCAEGRNQTAIAGLMDFEERLELRRRRQLGPEPCRMLRAVA